MTREGLTLLAVLALAAGLLWSGMLTPRPQDQPPGAGIERTDFIIVTGTSSIGAERCTGPLPPRKLPARARSKITPRVAI